MSTLQASMPTSRVQISQRTTPDDARLHCVVAQAVLSRLRSSPYRVLRSLTCEFRSGELHLQGIVPTYYMKQMAQETIRSVSGMKKIINRVTVLPCESETR